jgi:septal ring factor EnvC (AmiA/AmiB activator)
MSREVQSFRIAASQSITENVIYSNVRANRRSFMFNVMLITKNSKQKNSIFINIVKKLIFWTSNDSVRVIDMINQIRNEVKKMIKKYNDQCDIIDALQDERKTLKKKIATLKNDKIDDKYTIRALREKLKILETAQNRTRNVREFITSSFRSSTAD